MRFRLPIIVALFATTLRLQAWNEVGHILVTRLAYRALPADLPAWLKTKEVEDRLAYLCGEPDRWRGANSAVLNDADAFGDHFLDVEELQDADLTLGNLPPYRGQYLEELGARTKESPKRPGTKYDPAIDYNPSHSTPGFLPYAIEENRDRILASWTLLKTYEQYPDVVKPEELAAERATIIHYMGILAHYVGDSAQPLHTTKNYNGWTSANPNGYTADKKFHSYIDGTVLALHKITLESFVEQMPVPEAFNPGNPWPQLLADIAHTNSKVELLYQLQKSGDLDKTPGRDFIFTCISEGGARLAGLWISAFQGAKIDPYTVRQMEGRRAPASGALPSVK